MEEKNEPNRRPRYIWPRFVLAGVVLWGVLIIIWMTVLVRRTREQRDYTPWPQTAPVVPPRTNSAAIETNAVNRQ
jgi:hypothetical protein